MLIQKTEKLVLYLVRNLFCWKRGILPAESKEILSLHHQPVRAVVLSYLCCGSLVPGGLCYIHDNMQRREMPPGKVPPGDWVSPSCGSLEAPLSFPSGRAPCRALAPCHHVRGAGRNGGLALGIRNSASLISVQDIL